MNKNTRLEELEQELLSDLEKDASKIDFAKRKEEMRKGFEALDEEAATIMERYLRINEENGLSIPFMAESYLFLLDENDKEELYFYRNGHYRYSKLEEVIHQVYNDTEYMKRYMAGVAVSLILWPQHRAYFSYFREFLKKHQKDTGAYLEVGAGHGIFCSEALRKGAFSRYDVVDISETSLELTRQMTQEYSNGKKLRLIHEDFLQYHGGKYAVISIGEVLEHVECPQDFVQKGAELLDKNGRLYLTTCINAPEIDHISLFATIEEVERLFDVARLSIDDKLYIPYKDTTLERCMRQKLPVNVAYILKH